MGKTRNSPVDRGTAQLTAKAQRAWTGLGRSLSDPKYNAFQHAYSAALLAREYGYVESTQLGILREANTWVRHGYRKSIAARQDVRVELNLNDGQI